MVVSHDKIIKRQIKCKYCRKWISEQVSSYCCFCYLGLVMLMDSIGATLCKLFDLAGWEGGFGRIMMFMLRNGHGTR